MTQPQGFQRQGGPGPAAGQQWSGGHPVAATSSMGSAKILPVLVGAFGVLNFIWGFLALAGRGGGSASNMVFAGAGGVAPIVMLIAGLLALGPVVARGRSYTFPVAAISVAGALGALFSLVAAASPGIGLILLLIFGLLQAVAAVFMWLVEADLLKLGSSTPTSYGATGAPWGGGPTAPPGSPASPAPPAQPMPPGPPGQPGAAPGYGPPPGR